MSRRKNLNQEIYEGMNCSITVLVNHKNRVIPLNHNNHAMGYLQVGPADFLNVLVRIEGNLNSVAK